MFVQPFITAFVIMTFIGCMLFGADEKCPDAPRPVHRRIIVHSVCETKVEVVRRSKPKEEECPQKPSLLKSLEKSQQNGILK